MTPARWKELYERYDDAMKRLIEFEEFHDSHMTDIAAVNEQRDALGHVMTIIHSEFIAPTKLSDDELLKVFNGAMGHLNRAFCDVSEMYLIAAKQKINRALKFYSYDTIKEVIPNYLERLKEGEKHEDSLKSARSEKSQSANTNIYNEAVAFYGEFYKEVKYSVQALAEHKRDMQRSFVVKSIIEKIIFAVIGGVIVFFITQAFK